MKKLIITLAIAALIFCSIALVACNKNQPTSDLGSGDSVNSGDNQVQGGNSQDRESGSNVDDNETEDNAQVIAGVLSETIFDSVEDAVKGFLEEEVSGSAFTAVYVGYTKIAELSQEEINGIASGDKSSGQITSAEIGEVEYTEQSSPQEIALASSANSSFKRNIYIVVRLINDLKKYQFYTPIAEAVGESMTRSSMLSLLNEDKYINCTYTIYEEDDEEHAVYIFADNAFYCFGEGGVCYLYCGQKFYVLSSSSSEKEWKVDDLIDINDFPFVEDLSQYKRMVFNDVMYEMLDVNIFEFISKYYSYFIKTDTGYNLQASNFGVDNIGGYTDYDITVTGEIITACVNNWFNGGYIKAVFSNVGTTTFVPTEEMLKAIEEYNNEQSY